MSIAVTNAIWDNSKSSGTELLVMLCLSNFANNEGICWPSVAKISEMVKRDVRTVQRSLRTLEKSGELVVLSKGGMRKVGKESRYYTNVYRITLVPGSPDVIVESYRTKSPRAHMIQEATRADEMDGTPSDDGHVAEPDDRGDKKATFRGDTHTVVTVSTEPSVQALAKANVPGKPGPVDPDDKPVESPPDTSQAGQAGKAGQADKPDRPAKPKAPCNSWHPETTRFLEMFADRYKAAHGAAYAVLPKDRGCANRLLHATKTTSEVLVAVAEKAWSGHPALARMARQISTFCMNFNHVQAEVSGESRNGQNRQRGHAPVDYSKGW